MTYKGVTQRSRRLIVLLLKQKFLKIKLRQGRYNLPGLHPSRPCPIIRVVGPGIRVVGPSIAPVAVVSPISVVVPITVGWCCRKENSINPCAIIVTTYDGVLSIDPCKDMLTGFNREGHPLPVRQPRPIGRIIRAHVIYKEK